MLELEAMTPGFKKIATEMTPTHMGLIAFDQQTLNVEAEVRAQIMSRGADSQVSSIPTRWGTGSCQISSTSSSLNSTGLSSSSAPESSRKSSASSLRVEIVSPPLSQNRLAKVPLDHDLTALCDWFREK